MSELENDKAIARILLAGLEKASDVSRTAAVKHVLATRRRNPEATPAEIIKKLERHFTSTVATSGAAAGGTAAAPGVGLPVGIAAAVADIGVYSAVAGLYIFSLAEVYGIPTEDVVRRRTLIIGIMLGDSAQKTISEAAGRTGAHWAKAAVNKVPVETLRQINRVLGRHFVTKYGTKQGILVLGRVVPFGVGAAIGAGGNAVFSRFTVKSARRAFGPAPAEFPVHLSEESTASPTKSDTPGDEGEDIVDADLLD